MLLDFDRLINKYDMNVTGIIHIGAHYGEEYKIYIKYDSIKEMNFFEPDPDSFKVLYENIKDDSRVRIYNIALGPEECFKTFYKSSNQGESSSLLKPLIHLRQYPHIKFEESDEIRVEKLDNFYFSDFSNLINIDVQGFELEVFKGGTETLRKIDYIIAEVNRDQVYENCCMVTELDSFLSKYGFERAETTWDGGTWGDAFYIKGGL